VGKKSVEPDWMIALWKRPVDHGDRRWAATETPPADSPKIVT
jgi:hypothetical protein